MGEQKFCDSKISTSPLRAQGLFALRAIWFPIVTANDAALQTRYLIKNVTEKGKCLKFKMLPKLK
jgi:hypothetical protein